MEMDIKLIESAIRIAEENKYTFNFNLLKKELHLGLATCNRILNELEKSGVIKQHNKQSEGKYKIEVLI